MNTLTELEAGKTYQFIDEQSKRAYIDNHTNNRQLVLEYYDNGFILESISINGTGCINDEAVITIDELKYFKEKVDNTKQFTKDMLEAGKHVVELNNGERYLVINTLNNQTFVNIDAYFTSLNSFDNNLKMGGNTDHKLTVKKVYNIYSSNIINNLLSNDSSISLIWERGELTEKQKQINELKATIEQAKKQIEDLEALD